MITKDQIKQAALARGFKLSNDAGDDLKPYVYEFARDMIALAQKVRPLVFGRKHTVLRGQTSFGEYTIYYYNPDKGYVIELSSSEEEIGDVYESVAEAIAAAQADFTRRVLANLTHGVADEN